MTNQPCPSTFTPIPEGCFLVAAYTKTQWAKAETECQLNGTHVHLATLDSQQVLVLLYTEDNFGIQSDPLQEKRILYFILVLSVDWHTFDVMSFSATESFILLL